MGQSRGFVLPPGAAVFLRKCRAEQASTASWAWSAEPGTKWNPSKKPLAEHWNALLGGAFCKSALSSLLSRGARGSEPSVSCLCFTDRQKQTNGTGKLGLPLSGYCPYFFLRPLAVGPHPSCPVVFNHWDLLFELGSRVILFSLP